MALFLAAAVGTSSVTASEHANGDRVSETAKAGLMCMVSANESGADQSPFSDESVWELVGKGSYSHRKLPLTIKFKADRDGISRSCVVLSILESASDAKLLRAELEAALKSKPEKFSAQSGMGWFVNTKEGQRGLVLRTYKKDGQTNAELMGAIFHTIRRNN
ncbi:hypothetical protein [Tsuneonella troitsensis]|uniref:hypothetical protein n=1 Tax=Tsuneonella troitsensis TaxID=292222 RepID=UPI00070CF28F|nr:hypothetical protein [Tsuneonella troitsensis]